MKILFEDKIKGATITALAANANYPASNLAHVFSKVKYKGVGYSDTITCEFEDDESISSFWYTYTNASAMEVRLYSSASLLLDTITVDCTYNSGAEYFPQVDGVRRIEIDVSCPVAEDIYLGAAAVGLDVDFPIPLATFDKISDDNSGKTVSADGQTSYHYIKPLRAYELSFTDAKRETVFHPIVEAFDEVGKGHVWIDITESNHAVYQPMYCTTEGISNVGREKRNVSFKLKITEAR